jgi:NAD(P)-dependent dehydrogenase (short-subunit alcohol dehydrogenase family)
LSSRRAYLIVGASGTIGSAVAAQLAAPEVSLGLHYCRNERAANELKARLETAGALCLTVQSNLADDADCRDLVERFHQRFGAVNGVALCAGTVPWQAWDTLDTDAWQRALFEHCLAPFTIAAAAAKRMDAGGRIVFLSSIAPKYGGSSKSLHYAAAKGALEAAMRGLARELAPAGVCVNAVRAGFVDTPQQRSGRTPEEIAKRVAKIPAGRAGTPDEVASALVYLLSERAGFVNGELLTVAGGD